MAKNDKKIKVLQDRIATLEKDMQEALQKKRHNTTFDVAGTTKKINELKLDIKKLQ